MATLDTMLSGLFIARDSDGEKNAGISREAAALPVSLHARGSRPFDTQPSHQTSAKNGRMQS